MDEKRVIGGEFAILIEDRIAKMAGIMYKSERARLRATINGKMGAILGQVEHLRRLLALLRQHRVGPTLKGVWEGIYIEIDQKFGYVKATQWDRALEFMEAHVGKICKPDQQSRIPKDLRPVVHEYYMTSFMTTVSWLYDLVAPVMMRDTFWNALSIYTDIIKLAFRLQYFEADQAPPATSPERRTDSSLHIADARTRDSVFKKGGQAWTVEVDHGEVLTSAVQPPQQAPSTVAEPPIQAPLTVAEGPEDVASTPALLEEFTAVREVTFTKARFRELSRLQDNITSDFDPVLSTGAFSVPVASSGGPRSGADRDERQLSWMGECNQVLGRASTPMKQLHPRTDLDLDEWSHMSITAFDERMSLSSLPDISTPFPAHAPSPVTRRSTGIASEFHTPNARIGSAATRRVLSFSSTDDESERVEIDLMDAASEVDDISQMPQEPNELPLEPERNAVAGTIAPLVPIKLEINRIEAKVVDLLSRGSQCKAQIDAGERTLDAVLDAAPDCETDLGDIERLSANLRAQLDGFMSEGAALMPVLKMVNAHLNEVEPQFNVREMEEQVDDACARAKYERRRCEDALRETADYKRRLQLNELKMQFMSMDAKVRKLQYQSSVMQSFYDRIRHRLSTCETNALTMDELREKVAEAEREQQATVVEYEAIRSDLDRMRSSVELDDVFHRSM